MGSMGVADATTKGLHHRQGAAENGLRPCPSLRLSAVQSPVPDLFGAFSTAPSPWPCRMDRGQRYTQVTRHTWFDADVDAERLRNRFGTLGDRLIPWGQRS
jgi:hypothetical protein